MKSKSIEIPPFIKKIGRKTYIVDNWFDNNAPCDLTDKLKRLADRDISALQSANSEVTLTYPDRFGCNKKEVL
jgi:hypothetical protein